MKRIVYLLLLNIVVFTSCVEEFNANLPYSDQDLLVVEGDIVSNSDMVFNFSKTFSLSEEELPDGYNDIQATVHVVGSDGYRSAPGVAIDKGSYQVSVGQLSDDATYWMEVEYNGNTYRSSPEKPLYTEPIDSVSYHQVDYGNIDIRVSTHDITTSKKYYMWSFVEDWEIESRYYVCLFYDPDTNRFTETEDAPYYYCWNSNISSKILIDNTESLSENRIINKVIQTIDPTSQKVQTLYCITLKQRAISKEAYDFYENKQKQSESMGGLFTPQPSELPSNITCVTDPSKKAIGYVGVAKNVSHYRRFITKSELAIPGRTRCAEPTEDLITNQDKYFAGFRPVEWSGPAEALWSDKECTDCRVGGGNKNKPSFWPNDHK